MVRIRNKNWLEDEDLKADLTRYVHEGLSRSEILDFVSWDYSIYAWSIRTLDRRLREYQIFYNEKNLMMDKGQWNLNLLGLGSNSDTEPCIRKSDSCMSSTHHEVLCMM